jgi:hypothetical protein
MDEARIEDIVDGVVQRLEGMSAESPFDIYVWDDGAITGPPTGNETAREKAIAVFSPGDRDTPRDELRTTIVSGLETAREVAGRTSSESR